MEDTYINLLLTAFVCQTLICVYAVYRVDMMFESLRTRIVNLEALVSQVSNPLYEEDDNEEEEEVYNDENENNDEEEYYNEEPKQSIEDSILEFAESIDVLSLATRLMEKMKSKVDNNFQTKFKEFMESPAIREYIKTVDDVLTALNNENVASLDKKINEVFTAVNS
jgi:uncharacterized protein YjgD (DUF1641 family)